MTTGPVPPAQRRVAGPVLPGAARPVSAAAQYLVLRLGEQEYAVDILHVQEIRPYEESTRVVQAREFVRGVVNLRGRIVPVADLRLMLGLGSAECGPFTVTVVFNRGAGMVGAVVDAVVDVVALPADEIKPVPQYRSTKDARFILGLAQHGDRALLVLDVPVLLSDAELGLQS